MEQPVPERKPDAPKRARITNWQFGWESPPPSSPNAEKQELEYLWREFEECLETCENKAKEPVAVLNESGSKEQRSKPSPCCQDKRNERLNEEIEIQCRDCGHILQEIHDVCAPFLTQ